MPAMNTALPAFLILAQIGQHPTEHTVFCAVSVVKVSRTLPKCFDIFHEWIGHVNISNGIILDACR